MKYVPGVIVKVKWPVGPIEIWHDNGAYEYFEESADPNDHYRPWMKKHVGRQGIDWQWDIIDNDISTNKLSIKFRKGKTKYASLAMIKWG